MPDASNRPDLFALDLPLQSRLVRAAFAAARPLLSRGLRLDGLEALYDIARSHTDTNFPAAVLRALDIRVVVTTGGRGSIPTRGPLIVAANHPTGALDGLVLAETLRQVRPDARLLANHLLKRVPELADACFFVDPFGGTDSAHRSQAGLRAAHLWLRRGGALVMFPSGEVASGAADGPWGPTLGRLARATGARVLPCFLAGGNSPLFYAAGHVHPSLRTALLGRELLNKRGRTARIVVGRSLDAHDAPTPDAFSALAREAVLNLAKDAGTCRIALPVPVVEPICADRLDRDVRALPARARLLSSGPLDVYVAAADALPSVLQEIGRLRELTFRSVGEGTGQAVDLDPFDSHYEHVFVWNARTRQVVGAYRIGDVEEIRASRGVAGLYTSTLFRFDDRLLDRIGPSLELGRSFVRAEYQRSYSALLLLWRGIGRRLARSPRCRVLFGPVSISNRYQDMSQQLLRAFLTQNHGNRELESLLDPINPPPTIAAPARDAVAAADVDALDSLVRRLEGSQGIPVLLRQYLRLNATLLGFNIDPAFGDALDALMMVNVDRLPASLRDRYLGVAREELAA